MSNDSGAAIFAFGSMSVTTYDASGSNDVAIPARFAVPRTPVSMSDLDYGVPADLALNPEKADWFDEFESAMQLAYERLVGFDADGDLECQELIQVYHAGYTPDMEDPFPPLDIAA